MNADGRSRYTMPRLLQVRLRSFTLYARRPDVEVNIGEGVLCLAGANGIGKSTLLSAITYGLTGRVPIPSRSYDSAQEYLKDSESFTKSYFTGRIAERDRPTAAVGLTFRVGQLDFAIERSLFELDTLQALHIASATDSGVIYDGVAATPAQRHSEYANRMTDATGLGSFDQFVFLQHFLFTFDESRNLLFWNPKALAATLHLAFGGTPAQQARADELRRAVERADSRGRNRRYQALDVSRRLKALQAEFPGPLTDADMLLESEFDHLLKAEKEAREAAKELEVLAADAELALAEASGRLAAARQSYAAAFSEQLAGRLPLNRHPIYQEVEVAHRCGLCGAEDETAVRHARERLAEPVCPVCESDLSTSQPKLDADRLRLLDEEIATARQVLETAMGQRERTRLEYEAAASRAAVCSRAVVGFEDAHSDIVRQRSHRDSSHFAERQAEIDRLKSEYDTLVNDSKQEYAQRDELRKQLTPLQYELERQYAETESVFVPSFRALAERFLGMPIDVVFQPRGSGGSDGPGLVLVLRDAKRRSPHQLSESQRFFLDIALRMSLMQLLSTPVGPATLFIDTPEGSLDIAYEARAGEMIARFALGGHSVIMTANVNTSQLLQKLASLAGREHMSMVRMTEWAQLSEVQVEEEGLFEQAYDSIESALHGAVR